MQKRLSIMIDVPAFDTAKLAELENRIEAALKEHPDKTVTITLSDNSYPVPPPPPAPAR